MENMTNDAMMEFEELEMVEELGDARDFCEGVAVGVTIVGGIAAAAALT